MEIDAITSNPAIYTTSLGGSLTKLTLSHSLGLTCWPGKYLFTGVLTCGGDDGQPPHPRSALRLRPSERIRFAKVTLCHSVGGNVLGGVGAS
jgi:hypothetical protein